MEQYTRRTWIKRNITIASVSAGMSAAVNSAEAVGLTNPLESVQQEPIKITGIKVTLLSYVLPREHVMYVTKWLWWKFDSILVEVFTDQGVVGIGAASPFYRDQRLIKAYIEDIIAPALVGKNPFDVEYLTCGGMDFLDSSAWAGVQNACWDIIGKVKGLPVYKILATDEEPSPRIRIYASGGCYHTWYEPGDGRPYGFDILVEEALRYKEQGFTAFKFRPGSDWELSGMTMERFIPGLYRLREAVGGGYGPYV